MREPPEPPMTAYREGEGDEEVAGLRMMEADVEDSGLRRNKLASAASPASPVREAVLTFYRVRDSSMGWATDRMHQERRGLRNHL